MRGLSLVRGALLALVVVMLSGCGYNQIQSKDEATKAGWSEVLNQYKRRADLIPNLVATVKGYAAHEAQVLTAVTEARAKVSQINVNADDAASLAQYQAAQGELSQALGRLMMVTEAYPNLKADTQMSSIMEELKSTENKVAFARQAYNDGVMVYNTARERFPAVLIAGMLGFLPAQLFEVTNIAAKEAPKVQF